MAAGKRKGRSARLYERFGGTPPTLDLEGVKRLMRQCDRESDRGVALLVGAYLDKALEQAIRRCLLEDETDAVSLFDEGQGPLSTFSARIKMAHALGVLPEETRRDLDLLREIRNDFAHYPDELTFKTQSVQDRCNATSLAQRRNQWPNEVRELRAAETDPRLTFIRTAGTAIAVLAFQTSGRSRPPKPIPLAVVVAPRRQSKASGAPST